ncbi:hypothetical protein [Nocardia sp. IFM 10818]
MRRWVVLPICLLSLAIGAFFGIACLVNGGGYLWGAGRAEVLTVERAYWQTSDDDAIRYVEGFYFDESADRRSISLASDSIQPGAAIDVRLRLLPWGGPKAIHSTGRAVELLIDGALSSGTALAGGFWLLRRWGPERSIPA